MSEQEKIERAEEFVRQALKHLSSPADEATIKAAAKKAAKSLPPYENTEARAA